MYIKDKQQTSWGFSRGATKPLGPFLKILQTASLPDFKSGALLIRRKARAAWEGFGQADKLGDLADFLRVWLAGEFSSQFLFHIVGSFNL